MKKAVFIEIDRKADRVTRYTAYDNEMRKRMKKADDATTRLLEAEQWRLIQTWYK